MTKLEVVTEPSAKRIILAMEIYTSRGLLVQQLHMATHISLQEYWAAHGVKSQLNYGWELTPMQIMHECLILEMAEVITLPYTSQDRMVSL
jgi:hypothetical protein